MTPSLTRCQQPLYYVVAGENFPGPNPGLWGGCTDLRGDCSGLRGDCSGLWGDLDACEITDAERRAGIDIERLVAAAAE